MNCHKRLLLSAALGVIALAAQGARAQALQPPPEMMLDVNGVNVLTGQPVMPTQTISIGDEASALSRTSTQFPNTYEDYWWSGAGMSEVSSNTIRFMGKDYTFGGPVNNISKALDGSGVELECSQAHIQNNIDCKLFLKDGTIGYFTPKTLGVAPNTFLTTVLSKIVKPDGEILTISTSPGGASGVGEVQSVVSSLGWMLKYKSNEYGIASITAVNLAKEYCSPTLPCDTFTNTWAVLNVSAEGQDLQYTGATFYDIAGKATTVSTERTVVQFNNDGITTPGEALNKHTITSPAGRVKTIKYYSHELDGQNNWRLDGPPESFGTVLYIYSGGVRTEYNYGVPVGSMGSVTGHWASFGNYVVDYGPCDYTADGSYMQVADVNNTISQPSYEMYKFKPIKVQCAFSLPRLYEYKDKLGNITAYEYDSYARISKIIHPELNYEAYEYDDRGNIKKIIYAPKPSMGSARVVTAGYSNDCPNRLTCNKPQWTRDAIGNEPANLLNAAYQTDYEYYSAAGESGAVKSITYPPDESGVRRKERFFYAQYNPYVYTSSTTVSPAAPVWRLIRKEACASTIANCTAATDEKTIYQYENSNRMLSAEIKAAGNANPSNAYSATNYWQKTSYTYDNRGNIITVDGPRTDVDDATWTTYNGVTRLKVFEIGPDPDDIGPLKRSVVRHIYDGDGFETETQFGTYNNANGAAFSINEFKIANSDSAPYTIASKKRMYYDGAGRPTKTEVVVP